MNYYEDLTGTSNRWDRDWVRVLPIPNRYPQGAELLELQQTAMSGLGVHHTAYEVVNGLRGTLSSDGTLITISQGIIWCAIGQESYTWVPRVRVPIPTNATQLGIELVRESVGAGYDSILGGIPPLLWEAPLDRVRVYARYVWGTPDMLPILTVLNGVVYHYSDKVNPLRDTVLRTYMRELDGDYVAYGLEVTYHDGWVHVGAGKAWVGGAPIEVEAQPIAYREGTLQLCSDGKVAIEGSFTTYTPEYSAIVSSVGTPILMGNQYGVVIPHALPNPYLIPHRCIPLALLEGIGASSTVMDIAARVPTQGELLRLLSDVEPIPQGNQLGDINHPLYKVRVSQYLPNGEYEAGGVIYLPRVTQVLTVPGYAPPSTRLVLEESTVRTDWIDSAPTPSTPPPPPPFVYAEGLTVRAYNLEPNGTYTPNPNPSTVIKGALVGISIRADQWGMLEYQSPDTPVDLSGIIPTATPNLSVGLGQSFRVLTPTMVATVSLYLRAGYQGVLSICTMQGSQPYGVVLAWVPVSSIATGWLDIAIGPVYLPPGTYALISQSVVGSVIGRRHYLLPTLDGTPETTNSMNMLLSQGGVWQSLPNMDLMYRIHKATPTATYRDRYVVVEWSEAFDGYEYVENYNLPPSTYITCTALTREGGTLLGKTFPPRTSMVLGEALFGTDTLFPTVGTGEVKVYITSKSGTWISREELVGNYTSIRVSLNAQVPEGSAIALYVNSGSGWVPLELIETMDTIGSLRHASAFARRSYHIGGLSPTTSSTDINGVVREVVRERLRVRIELSTLSPEIQPYVWGLEISAM